MRKQIQREPERIRRWKAELERQIAAEKEQINRIIQNFRDYQIYLDKVFRSIVALGDV